MVGRFKSLRLRMGGRAFRGKGRIGFWCRTNWSVPVSEKSYSCRPSWSVPTNRCRIIQDFFLPGKMLVVSREMLFRRAGEENNNYRTRLGLSGRQGRIWLPYYARCFPAGGCCVTQHASPTRIWSSILYGSKDKWSSAFQLRQRKDWCLRGL